MAFQDKLIEKGWVKKQTLEWQGEYGSLGQLTYQVIYEVQQYYEQYVGYEILTPVRDAGGFYRENHGGGAYYPIDEPTYRYIMTELAEKP